VHQALATGGLEFWVNAVYAITDVLFFAQAGPAVITGLAGRDVVSHHPVVRKIVHLLGLPIITVANALLATQLGIRAVQLGEVGDIVMFGPAVVLTLATAYLAKLGIAVELGLGRIAPRKGAWANAYLNVGLLAFGVIGLLPAHWPVVVLGLTGGAAVLLGLSKIDTWRSTRIRGPPPALRPQRDATEADLDRIRREAIVNPDGRGVVLVPPGDALRAHALELRVGDGDVVLVMHGDQDGFVYPTAEAVVRVSPAQVAALLERLLPGSAPSGPLTVCACSLAASPETAGRELAERTGRTVVASWSTVRVHRPGRAGARVTTDGGWLEINTTGPSRAAFPPLALLDPKAVPGAQRLGPPGVRLPIAPRAPPATASAAGAVDGDLLITQEQRAFATERAALHGGETLQKSRKQRRSYASYQFVKDTNWTGALMGDLVEELGRPGMARLAAANGERLLANVTLVAIGSRGQRRAFDELDFLFAAGPAGDEVVTRYVSAKANPRNFKRGKDLLKVETLFRDVPTGSVEQLRAWLGAHTKLTPAEVETSVAVEVEWRSGEAGEVTSVVSLDEFRDRFRAAGELPAFPVELLAPTGFRTGIHELELTWNQVADVAIAAIRRYLDE
jgi:hypothetical protein